MQPVTVPVVSLSHITPSPTSSRFLGLNQKMREDEDGTKTGDQDIELEKGEWTGDQVKKAAEKGREDGVWEQI